MNYLFQTISLYVLHRGRITRRASAPKFDTEEKICNTAGGNKNWLPFFKVMITEPATQTILEFGFYFCIHYVHCEWNMPRGSKELIVYKFIVYLLLLCLFSSLHVYVCVSLVFAIKLSFIDRNTFFPHPFSSCVHPILYFNLKNSLSAYEILPIRR